MVFEQVNSNKLKQAESLQKTAIELYNKGEWDKAKEYYERSLRIFEELENKRGISIACNNLGLFYQNRGKWDQAKEYYEKSLRIFEELVDKQGISKSYNNLGILCVNRGEWDNALDFYEKSMEIKKEVNDQKGLSRSYNNIGLIYKDKGEWDKALDFYEKSLRIKEENKDQQGISSSLSNLGILYTDKGELNRAMGFFEKSLKIDEVIGNKKGISGTYNNIGTLYKIKGEWDKALGFYEKSLEIDQDLGDQQGLSKSYNNLGNLYKDKVKWDKANEFFKNSIKICQKLGDKHGVLIALNNFGELNLKSGNLDIAKKFLKASLKKAKSFSPISTVSIFENLGELSTLEEEYDNAVEILEESLKITEVVGAKPQKINILVKLGDVYLNKYLTEENSKIKALKSAENNYRDAFELAHNLEMPLQEATALRGLGIVESKKGDINRSKEYFHKSFEILRKLGFSFELQNTTLEYAKVLYENKLLFEAEISAKSASLDAQRSNNYELLRKAYLLLGDIAEKIEDKYEYYLESLKIAEFNSKIYVRNCFHLISRMQKMEKKELMRFIVLLKEQNNEKYFALFLDALNNKIERKDFNKAELPFSLEIELEKFEMKNLR